MADEERTIQVPASLARAIVGQLRTDAEQIDGEWGWGRTVAKIRESSDPDDYGKEGVRLSDELEALLSQPTPTAEQTRAVEEYEDERDRAIYEREGVPYPEPPPIEDMAPGVRCREEVPGTVPSWAGEDQIDPCPCVLAVGHDGRHQCGHQVDPSTIRDVTPPEVTT